MSGPRKAIVSVLLAALLPVAVFFLGLWGPDAVQQLLWVPAESTRDALQSLCSSPKGSSFVCLYGEGQHNRLFFTSFYFVYLAIGLLIAGALFALRGKRTAVAP